MKKEKNLRILVSGSWQDITYTHLNSLSSEEFQRITAIEETMTMTRDDWRKYKKILTPSLGEKEK